MVTWFRCLPLACKIPCISYGESGFSVSSSTSSTSFRGLVALYPWACKARIESRTMAVLYPKGRLNATILQLAIKNNRPAIPVISPQATSSSSNTIAASLSRGWLLLPHLGDCTQEGQPSVQGHSSTALRVACQSSVIISNPFSAMPMPPG